MKKIKKVFWEYWIKPWFPTDTINKFWKDHKINRKIK